MRKKRLSVILSLLMILTTLNVGVSAASAKLPFTDVSTSSWFYDSVAYVYENELMNGMTETTFEPDNNLTRGMFVTILGRMAKVDPTQYRKTSFSDVQAGQWY